MDIVVCSALGADMYDSVYPTRTARFGVALVPGGTLKLKNSEYVEDFRCAQKFTTCMCEPLVRRRVTLRDADTAAACMEHGAQGISRRTLRSTDGQWMLVLRSRWQRRPLDEECDCLTCQQHSRAYLHALARRGLPAAAIAVTYHNVAYMQRLGRDIRAAIMEQRFPEYVRMFVRRHHPDGAVPQWIRTGLELAGIELDAN